MVKARAKMSFSGLGITASNGQEIFIENEKVFQDLYQAGFVEQVDRTSAETKATRKTAKEQ